MLESLVSVLEPLSEAQTVALVKAIFTVSTLPRPV